jgi:hypothetical protein
MKWIDYLTLHRDEVFSMKKAQELMESPYGDLELDDNFKAFITKDQVEFIDKETSEPVEFKDQNDLNNFLNSYSLNLEGAFVRNNIIYTE